MVSQGLYGGGFYLKSWRRGVWLECTEGGEEHQEMRSETEAKTTACQASWTKAMTDS